MPSSAQQSGIGIASTNAGFGGFATAGGAVRMTPAGVELEGAILVNLTVAFIGASAVTPMRAVSLRGGTGALRFSMGAATTPGFRGEAGRPGNGFGEGASGFADGGDAEDGAGGFKAEGAGGLGNVGFGGAGEAGTGAGGLRAEGGGVGAGPVDCVAAGGAGTGPDGFGAEGCVGKEDSDLRVEGDVGGAASGFGADRAGGNGGLGTAGCGGSGVDSGDAGACGGLAFASTFCGSGANGGEVVGGEGGRTAFGERGEGGRMIGGVGGRRTGAPVGGMTGFGATSGGGGETRGAIGELEPVPVVGGRAGKLIRVVSFATGTVGRCVGRGGKVIRTVSFFGSFRSAISL